MTALCCRCVNCGHPTVDRSDWWYNLTEI